MNRMKEIGSLLKTYANRTEKMESIVKIAVTVGLVLLLLVPTASAIGLGVAPPEFTIEDALKGSDVEKTITVVNVGDEEARFELTATGEIADWISFYELDGATPITTVQVPGEESKKIAVRFHVPSDAASGTYNSTIYVQTIPEEITNETGAAAAAVLKMSVDATIIVTGIQKLTGTVTDITTRDVEVGYPLKLNIKFQNTGNVIATPSINVEISSEDGEFIDSVVSSDAGVKPGVTDTITVTWDTTGQHVGAYVAEVTVLLGGETLYMQDLAFDILEPGALTRTGELTDLCCEGEPRVGELVKVLATFRNTGAIDTRAKFSGEIYRNRKLVGTIASEELDVPVTETCTLTSYYQFDEPGDYKISGYALYEGKQTETKEVLLEVSNGAAGHILLTPTILIGLGIAVALIVIFGVVLLRRKR